MSTFLLILITGIGLGALYFLVASGLSLIYGLMGVLNFAHGAFLTVGAFFWILVCQTIWFHDYNSKIPLIHVNWWPRSWSFRLTNGAINYCQNV